MKLMEIYSHLREERYRVYHGSRDKFSKFDLFKTAQGIAWFSDSIEDIKSGNAGANSSKYIMEFEITLDNPATWDDYDKYGIGELKDLGYDGVKLESPNHPTTYIVFDVKNIKYKGLVEE